MNSQSFNFYGGLVPAGAVQDDAHPIGEKDWPGEKQFWTEANPVRELPASAQRLNHIELSISSFAPGFMEVGGLHVCVWLCWGDKAVSKQSDGVLIIGNTGDSGACNVALNNLDLRLLSGKYRICCWSHNMKKDRADWHTNGVLIFKEDGDL